MIHTAQFSQNLMIFREIWIKFTQRLWNFNSCHLFEKSQLVFSQIWKNRLHDWSAYPVIPMIGYLHSETALLRDIVQEWRCSWNFCQTKPGVLWVELMQSRLRMTEDSRKTELGCKFCLSLVREFGLSTVILINLCYSFSSHNCQCI